MKKQLCFILIGFLTFVNCNKNVNIVEQEENKEYTLEGAWEIDSYINYRGDGNVDTINSSNEIKQMKMFSKTKVMWSKLREWDSLDWFGVGDYTYKDGILIEVLEYGSKPMQNRVKSKKPFDFDIVIDENSFTQIETDSTGNPIYAETYHRVK
jgi:hypothetical protein